MKITFGNVTHFTRPCPHRKKVPFLGRFLLEAAIGQKDGMAAVFGRKGLFDWVWVALGGALGSVLRYGAGGAVQRWNGSDWPIGTLAVNLAGSFIIGWLAQLILARGIMTPQARLFVMVGVLGGFTTFSTFSLETLRLIQQGGWGPAVTNIVLSVAGGLFAAWAGFAFSSSL